MGTTDFIMKPKVDYCFKGLMEVPQVRQGFVSALLGVSPEKIQDTVLLPTILEKKYGDDKLGILDVRVMFQDGTQIDIEIQVNPYAFWPERSIFYMSKLILEQIHEGQGYDVIKKCIHVGILDFTLFKEQESFYSCFHLWEDTRHTLYTDKMEIHILELPKLEMYEYPQTELLNWARFFNAEKREEMQAMASENTYISKAYEQLLNMSADDKKRLEYETREKAIRDYNSFLKYNMERGKELGLKEGKSLEQMRYSKLILKLLETGENDMIAKAASDSKILEELYRQYGL